MWLNNIRYQHKPLSPIELLVLLNTTTDYKDVSKLMQELSETFQYWRPERGTIYPLLRRLQAQNLLELQKTDKLRVRRTADANQFIATLFESLLDQIKANHEYYQAIIHGLIEVDPIGVIHFIQDYEKELGKHLRILHDLQKEAEVVAQQENWHRVELE